MNHSLNAKICESVLIDYPTYIQTTQDNREATPCTGPWEYQISIMNNYTIYYPNWLKQISKYSSRLALSLITFSIAPYEWVVVKSHQLQPTIPRSETDIPITNWLYITAKYASLLSPWKSGFSKVQYSVCIGCSILLRSLRLSAPSSYARLTARSVSRRWTP
jgi:hypothetical protein